MSEQTETMRDLVNQTVTSALKKEQMSKQGAMGGASDQEIQLYESKIQKFESQFREKDREIDELRKEKRQAVDAEHKQSLELEEARREQDKQAKELKRLIQQA